MDTAQACKALQEDGERWALDTDAHSMLFFRTDSYHFAFVDVTMAR